MAGAFHPLQIQRNNQENIPFDRKEYWPGTHLLATHSTCSKACVMVLRPAYMAQFDARWEKGCHLLPGSKPLSLPHPPTAAPVHICHPPAPLCHPGSAPPCSLAFPHRLDLTLSRSLLCLAGAVLTVASPMGEFTAECALRRCSRQRELEGFVLVSGSSLLALLPDCHEESSFLPP